MAASLRKFAANNDRVTITIFANTTLPFTLAEFFEMLDVKVVDIPYTFRPHEEWYGFYGGSFYLLDGLAYALYSTEANAVIFVDPDVLWVGDPEGLFRLLEEEGVLAYEIDYPLDHKVNGTSRNDLKLLFAELTSVDLDKVPTYW